MFPVGHSYELVSSSMPLLMLLLLLLLLLLLVLILLLLLLLLLLVLLSLLLLPGQIRWRVQSPVQLTPQKPAALVQQSSLVLQAVAGVIG
jgi:hypothetical protein